MHSNQDVSLRGHGRCYGIRKLEQTLLNGDISALIDASSVSFDNLFSTEEKHMQDISNLESLTWKCDCMSTMLKCLPIIRRLSMTILRMCVVVVSSCIRKKILRLSGLTTTWNQQCGLCKCQHGVC